MNKTLFNAIVFACTATEIDRYNEDIRVALMREASFVCDNE